MLSLFFSWRYFKSKKRVHAIQIINRISAIAIAFAVAALVIVLSAFNGFEKMVKDLYADFYADIKVKPQKGKTFQLSSDKINQIKQLANIKNLCLEVEEKGVLVNGDYQTIAHLKGVDEQYVAMANIKQHIVRGNYDIGTADKPFFVCGAGIENALALDVVSALQPCTIYTPNKEAKQLNTTEALQSFNIRPKGSFIIQQEFDNKYIITHVSFLKYLLHFKPDEYSYVEIQLKDASRNAETKTQLMALLGNGFCVETRYEQNKDLFSVMALEKWFIYAILTLIIVIASFNMIGSLSMLAIEKQKDFTLLQALGAKPGFIKQIIIQNGFLLAGIGGAVGLGLGLLVCIIQLVFHPVKLGGTTFLTSYYPIELRIQDFLLIIATVVCIATLASLYPAIKAVKNTSSLRN